jgi:hypothetical protein
MNGSRGKFNWRDVKECLPKRNVGTDGLRDIISNSTSVNESGGCVGQTKAENSGCGRPQIQSHEGRTADRALLFAQQIDSRNPAQVAWRWQSEMGSVVALGVLQTSSSTLPTSLNGDGQ